VSGSRATRVSRLAAGSSASAALLVALSAATTAQSVEFDPPSGVFDLGPGEQQSVHVTVCLPGQSAKVDVYFLADVTASMGPILDEVKANAQQIVTTLLATPGVDLMVGLGSYRDFFNLPPFPPQPYIPQLAPTDDVPALVDAINTWIPVEGGDGSEAQLYALHEIATNPVSGFRPDAKRIVVWFGDSPGHDPICDILVGFGVPAFEIDEALTTSVLQAGGPGGTTVIAIGTVTSLLVYPNALNDDPTKFNDDYEFFCDQGGLSGQASRLAAATGGVYTQVTDPSLITDTILDAVANLLNTADVSVVGLGDTLPFIQSITPPSYQDVVLPTSPEETVCVEFDVLLEGPPCAGLTVLFEGALEAQVDRQPLGSLPLALTQLDCYSPEGVMFIGIRRIDEPFPEGGPEDHLLVGDALLLPFSHGVSPLVIPDDPVLFDFTVYIQVAIKNGLAFPGDPLKVSHGLTARLGQHYLGAPYGVGGGLALELAAAPLLGLPIQLVVTVGP
jgi:hypothetical protein